MGENSNIIEMLQMLARIETGIADYYRACAEQWEQDREFWLDLARQEDGHCAMFKRMAALVGAAPERYSLRAPFNPQRSETFIGWMASCADEIKSGDLDRLGGFKAAAEIERTILEGNMQGLVLTNDSDFQQIVDTIVEQSKMHAVLIKTCAAEPCP